MGMLDDLIQIRRPPPLHLDREFKFPIIPAHPMTKRPPVKRRDGKVTTRIVSQEEMEKLWVK